MLLLRTFLRYLGKSMFTKVLPGRGEKTYLDLPVFNEVKDVRSNTIDRFCYHFEQPLKRSYLLKISDHAVERPQHMLMRVAVGIHGGDIDACYRRFHHKSTNSDGPDEKSSEVVPKAMYNELFKRYDELFKRYGELEKELGIKEMQLVG